MHQGIRVAIHSCALIISFQPFFPKWMRTAGETRATEWHRDRDRFDNETDLQPKIYIHRHLQWFYYTYCILRALDDFSFSLCHRFFSLSTVRVTLQRDEFNEADWFVRVYIFQSQGKTTGWKAYNSIEWVCCLFHIEWSSKRNTFISLAFRVCGQINEWDLDTRYMCSSKY